MWRDEICIFYTMKNWDQPVLWTCSVCDCACSTQGADAGMYDAFSEIHKLSTVIILWVLDRLHCVHPSHLRDFERLCTLPPWETLPLTQRSIAFRRVHLVKYWSSVVDCQILIIGYRCTDCQTLINNEQVVDYWSSILVVHTVKHQSTSWQEAWVKFRGEVKSFPVWQNA